MTTTPLTRRPRVSPAALGYLSVSAAYIIWGFSYLFTKTALKTAAPAVVLASRFLIAFILINLIRFICKIPVRLHWKDVKKLALLGLCNPVLYFYLESYGVLYTTTTFSGVMCAMSPLISLFLAAVFLKELPTKKQCGFSLLPIAGVVLITLSGKSEGLLSWTGVICLFLSCVMGSASSVVNRKLAAEYTSFERTYFMMTMGFLVFTLAAIAQTIHAPQLLWQPFGTPSFLVSVVCLGAVCSVGGFFCFNYAARCLPVTKTSVFGNLNTVVSIFAGAVILSEPVGLSYLVGTTLILGGIWLVARSANQADGAR